jgi:1,4-dihydroxy-2-naphthoyl-CoA hydrolase
VVQLELSPFGKRLAFVLVSRTCEATVAELIIRDELCDGTGLLHCGALLGWADAMGGMMSTFLLSEDQYSVTIESKTNFFASICVGERARAVCKPLYAIGKVQVLETTITRDVYELAAKITQTHLVFAKAR